MADGIVCQTFWGSHGCDLLDGHDGNHLCLAPAGPCSEYDQDGRVRYQLTDEAWSEWFPPDPEPPTLRDCDICGRDFPPGDSRYALTTRPSDPSEVVCVMWACPECGDKAGFVTEAEAERRFAEGYYGRQAAFLTIPVG